MFTSMREIESLNRRKGNHFFDADTVTFFRSRVSETIYGGRFFVTSEASRYTDRRYTVRRADSEGNIETMGEFGMFGTRDAAHRFAKKLAALPDGERTYQVTERQRDGYRANVSRNLTEMEAAMIALYLNDRTNVYGIPEGGMIYDMRIDS